MSEPIPGDPSATQASTPFMTVTMVDVSDPAAPKVTDRVRLEDAGVVPAWSAARVRLVTTSNLADLGFVVPHHACRGADRPGPEPPDGGEGSAVSDWIPDWQRSGDAPNRWCPCERVHARHLRRGGDDLDGHLLVGRPVRTGGHLDPGSRGHAVRRPRPGGDQLGGGSILPSGRPGGSRTGRPPSTSSASPRPAMPSTYRGSGIIDGSTVGQFAFGEVGDTLRGVLQGHAVVPTTPSRR